MCTHREASLCLSPVPSGLCVSVCAVGGFLWPSCCCLLLVHVAWAQSHMAWVGAVSHSPSALQLLPGKGKLSVALLHPGSTPASAGAALPSRPGKAAEMFELFVFCAPTSTLPFTLFLPLRFIHSCAPTKQPMTVYLGWLIAPVSNFVFIPSHTELLKWIEDQKMKQNVTRGHFCVWNKGLLVCPSHQVCSVAHPPECQGWKSLFLLCNAFSLCCSVLD